MNVREWMSSPPILAPESLSAPGALWKMEDRKVRRMPVVDDAGRLTGIVTRNDLREKLGPFPNSWARLKLHVTDAMTRDPVAVAPDTPLQDVARLMIARKISGLPVVEAGRVVGVITESDVFRALCAALAA